MEPKSRNPRRLLGWLGHGDDRAKLVDAARQAYDSDRVLALLADAPGNFPYLEDHRLWAHKEKQRAAQLEYARRHRRWDRVLAILDDVPPDYPNLASLRAEAVAAQRPETSPSSVPAQEDLTAGGPVEAPALAEPGRATVQLEPQPSGVLVSALAPPAEASVTVELTTAAPEIGAEPSVPLAPAEAELGPERPTEVEELTSVEAQAIAVAPTEGSPPADAVSSAPSDPEPVVDEALEELWEALPRILRRFEREEIDEVIECCQQHSALEELQVRAEEALESNPSNLTAYALAGGASAVRGHGDAALDYYAAAIEAIENGAKRPDWVDYFYLRAQALDASRAFAMIDREGGVYDTEEGHRHLYEQALALDPAEQARQTALAGLLAVAGCRRASHPLLAVRALISDLATSYRNVDRREPNAGYSELR